jgi:hypothetical protein
MEEEDDLTEDEPEGSEDVIETPPRRRQTGNGSSIQIILFN